MELDQTRPGTTARSSSLACVGLLGQVDRLLVSKMAECSVRLSRPVHCVRCPVSVRFGSVSRLVPSSRSSTDRVRLLPPLQYEINTEQSNHVIPVGSGVEVGRRQLVCGSRESHANLHRPVASKVGRLSASLSFAIC
jgi:hypothetical protein